ncbi:MAG: beta-ketoacyl synthase chain length factor [Oligosphaeraceae bacterium]|nr:beta-ketoacyl synthase chain length factor [Oligosphaeraceae bacterium]
MNPLYLLNCRIFSRFTCPLREEEIKAVRAAYALRRADRYTALAAAAVLGRSGAPFPSAFASDTGLITVSAFGPHKTVFATLDDILDYPEDMILPVRFSHSVHNAAAAYLGSILKITGPAFAVTGFEAPLFEALQLAQTLLQAKMCPQVLLIGIEERGLLTAAAPALAPGRFAQEPEEIICALRLSASPAPGARELHLDRDAGTAPCLDACTLGLPLETIRELTEPDTNQPVVFRPSTPI